MPCTEIVVINKNPHLNTFQNTNAIKQSTVVMVKKQTNASVLFLIKNLPISGNKIRKDALVVNLHSESAGKIGGIIQGRFVSGLFVRLLKTQQKV